ncbi:hypothetical protein TH66_09735 [Carbonactinospora thermoautotrophica]|uniref:Transcriptional regulator n=1 Tax=Carbonactinospora thermoautotrophica TaxID=1469144 RepID=A0A132MNE2_9ACTN|nr:TetR/AcrR family transcriptional regulator [Carbonactinospora thermoautotrophica]KWW99384.1 Transcriptional regulator [Carbonactinospora thermoautotrophica]KWX04166.1 hypothetical protein TH66_09735 [Carbonactinospora thermoautotrophica]KWX07303.1 hypothetical protein TR74_19205 [Carbonactinospora thermoautotrophica]
MAVPASRRERQREATLREIKQVARRLLVTKGAGAVSLRAIAREMGMTAPGLYRYFASHEELLHALCQDITAELCDRLEAARDAVEGDAVTRLFATARALRAWALEHRAEFGLTFGGTTLPDLRLPPECRTGDPLHEQGYRFGRIFFDLFVEVWRTRGFAAPDPADLDPRLVPQLQTLQLGMGGRLPLGACYVFLECWVMLYGIVSLEVYGKLDFALTDTAPMFESYLRRIADRLLTS